MSIKRHLALAAATLLMAAAARPSFAVGEEKQPAFPGAEGYGRYVTGGRGGKVYHVTNLNDTGNGSLRWALSQAGTKTIVFDVAGTIHLNSTLTIGSNTTVAGQTSPGGICLADYPVNVRGQNIIVRYMRFRLGNKNVTLDGADGWDAFGGMDSEDLMIDHCSVSWSIDECCSFLGNKNTTVQWCLVSQSLVEAGHSKGAHGYGGNWGGSGASFHHNLLVHHGSRTPRLGPRPTTQLDERMDYRNNVIYNFGGNGCYGGEAMKVNIVNNYYKPGPGSPTNVRGHRIAGIGIRTNSYVKQYPDYAPALHIWGKYFVEGNVNSKYPNVANNNWSYGMYDQITASDCDGTYTQATKDSIKLAEPIRFIYTTTHTAEDAYELVLQYAGACRYRDSYDTLMVHDARYGVATYTGARNSAGFINSQDDNKPADAGSDWSAWPELPKRGNAMSDGDGDGMDDEWEINNDLDPNDGSDGPLVADNGYTNLENYLNSIIATTTRRQNEGGTVMGDIDVVEAIKEYDITPNTSEGNWKFSNGITIDAGGASYAEGKSYGVSSIKYSRNKQYTINLPEAVSINKAEFTGNLNIDNGTAYLAELNGTQYDATQYVFSARANAQIDTHAVPIQPSAKDKLTFTFKGDGQVVMNIKLYADLSTGISEATVVSLKRCKGIFSLDGRNLGTDVSRLSKGLYIIDGRKVIIQ